MEIQKKNGTEITFDFQEESFVYKMKDSSGTRTLNLGYGEIDIMTIDEFVEHNEWFRNVWFIWLGLGVYDWIVTTQSSFWIMLWIIMLFIYYKKITRYSYLNSDSGKIFVIKDQKHDAIIDRILSEKRKLLRDKLFFFNAENSLEQELSKYQYLKDNGAISQDEFEQKSQELFREHGVIRKQLSE